MTGDRYALLGVGLARSSWFGDVALWTTSGAVPADFTKCLSLIDARQRLNGLQPFSVLLVEAGIAGLDREIIDCARRAGTPTFVIADEPTGDVLASWTEAGATAVLPKTLTPGLLLHALTAHARIITSRPIDTVAWVEHLATRTGNLVAVCGPGGTGASTVAMALAQGLANDVTETDHVLLADFARNGEQAMLHDSPDIVPGVEEVVDLHRNKQASVEEIRALTFSVEQRGYRLLLGRRRPSAWTTMPPAASTAAITGLRKTFRTVVADITADFEREADGGSVDVEERNALSLRTALDADVVFVVGGQGMKGVHSLTTLLRQLAVIGVDGDRLVPVINRLPRRGGGRADVTRAIVALSKNGAQPAMTNAPVFLPDRPIDDLLRNGERLPKQLTEPLTAVVQAFFDERERENDFALVKPVRITPGSLGLAAGE